MNKYTEVKNFLEAVKNNNIKKIHFFLLEFILEFGGNKNELESAITYATSNSDFKFEFHKDMYIDETFSDFEIYTAERLNMNLNYSKERFDKLVNLYPETYGKENKNRVTEDVEIKNTTNNSNTVYYIIGGLVVAFVVYKLVS